MEVDQGKEVGSGEESFIEHLPNEVSGLVEFGPLKYNESLLV